MRDLYVVVITLLTLSRQGEAMNIEILNDGSELLTSDAMTAKQPVIKTATNILSRQCEPLKNLLGANNKRNKKPDLSKLTLDFFTRDVSITYKLSDAAELIPRSPYFKYQNKIIIYCHGFIDNPHFISFPTVNRAFQEQGEYNVLALDASSKIGLDTLYPQAATNVRYIGEKLGAVLAKMVEMGIKPKSIYLIGHSLGSQIVGFTGKTFKKLAGQRVGRITGLDPAGPCFTTVPRDMKLEASDADFVDVIHTNAGAYGINQRVGHADFYPNGGSVNPGCLTQLCHDRAWRFYAETVLYPRSMPAVFCDSWGDFKRRKCIENYISYMGFGCSNTTRGTYFLQTAGNYRYGLGDQGTVYGYRGIDLDLGLI